MNAPDSVLKEWKKLKPFKVGDIITMKGSKEFTEIVKVNGWQFWTKNNWCGGGNLLEGGNWRVFILAKRKSFLNRILNKIYEITH